MFTGEGEGNKGSYIEHIGLFFFFIACAGISIIVWVFNWICWLNQCCCCDFLHNPINKRLVWWTSFIFALGILACCIAGFVTTNRFGFALEGSRCAFTRLYYDSKYGQLKETYPKWEGFKKILHYYDDFEKFQKIFNNTKKLNYDYREKTKYFMKTNENDYKYYLFDGYYSKDYLDKVNDILTPKQEQPVTIQIKEFINKLNFYTIPITSRYGKIIDSIYKLGNMTFDNTLFTNIFGTLNTDSDFDKLKNDFLKEFDYYAKIAKGWGKILTMIYLCLLCITITFAAVSMMFYVCLKRQGYLSTFMHILWNIVRFFMFSFFFYGAAYGMCYLALRDAVAFNMFLFSEDYLGKKENLKLLPSGKGKEFLQFCLLGNNSNFKFTLDPSFTSSLNDYFTNFKELNESLQNYKALESVSDTELNTIINEQKSMIEDIKYDMINMKNTICPEPDICEEYGKMALREGGLFGSFNCTFLKSDLNMMYRTLFDLSVEARILCALSCCIGFFGAIFVYFFLFVLHHYNNELFFDNGKNIFTGFEGIGNTKKRVNDIGRRDRF